MRPGVKLSLARANGLCGMAGVATDNQVETTFLLNFHSLLKQGNYSLLTEAEYQCASGDGFLLDVECTVRAPPPPLSQYRPLTALFSPNRLFSARLQFCICCSRPQHLLSTRSSAYPSLIAYASFHLPADERFVCFFT